MSRYDEERKRYGLLNNGQSKYARERNQIMNSEMTTLEHMRNNHLQSKPELPIEPSNDLSFMQKQFRGAANIIDGVTLSRFFGGDGLTRAINDRIGNEWTDRALSDDVNGQIKAADFTTDLLSPTLPMAGAYKAVDKGMDLTKALMNPKASDLARNAQFGKGGALSKQAWSETAGIGGMAGLTYNMGENAVAGIGGDQRSNAEKILNTSLEAGLGAGGDIAIRGLGKLMSNLPKNKVPEIPQLNQQIEPLDSTLAKLEPPKKVNIDEVAATMSKMSNPKEGTQNIGKLYENISAQKEVPLKKLDKRLIPETDNPTIDNPADLVKKQIDLNGKREKSKWSFDKVYTSLLDDLRPLDKATRDLGGKTLETSKNPYVQARLSRGVAGRAETYLKGGVYKDGKKVGQSLEEIVKPIQDDMDNFLAYVTSKRALDYDEKGLVAGIKPKNVEGFTDRQLAEETIKQLDNPEFQKAHQSLVQYSHRLLDELIEADVLTKEAVENIMKENPNYIPMFRVQEPKARGFDPLPKQRFGNLGEAIKSRTGSERAIVNPMESIIKNTYLMVNMAERNKVGKQLFDLVESAGDNGWGRIVNKKKGGMSLDDLTKALDDANVQLNDGKADAVDNIFKGEGNKINVYRNGEKVEMELQEDLYKAMLSLDTQKQNFFIKMLAVPTTTLRTGAVLSPDFGPVNIFRDQFSALFNSGNGFLPGLDMARGLAHVIKKDDIYWDWMNSGGANSVLSTLDREYLQNDIRRLIKQSMTDKVKTVAKNPLRTALEPLRKLSEITEEATRIGEFKKGKKKGLDSREAAFESRDLIDFSRAGNLGRQYNQVTAFFNAAVQSVDKMVRTFKKNPVGATSRGLVGITLPTMALYMRNHDQEWYQELPQREKDLFWHIKVGDTILKAPKPFEIGVLFGTIPERFAEYMKTADPTSFKDLEDTIKDTFLPPWIPTAIAPWIEIYANKSMYFDAPIVPRREEGLLPEDQYGPYTSELGKKVGDTFQVSPRKVDHVIKGYTGGLGRYALQMGDAATNAVGGKEKPELPDKGIGGLPIVNRFVVQNLEGNNQKINDFYETMDKLRRNQLSAKKNQEPFKDERLYQYFNKLGKDIGELQGQKREIIEHPDMNGKEKTERIKKLDELITKLAKRGLEVKQ